MNRGKALLRTSPLQGLPPTDVCSCRQVSLERQLEDSLALLSSHFAKLQKTRKAQPTLQKANVACVGEGEGVPHGGGEVRREGRCEWRGCRAEEHAEGPPTLRLWSAAPTHGPLRQPP